MSKRVVTAKLVSWHMVCNVRTTAFLSMKSLPMLPSGSCETKYSTAEDLLKADVRPSEPPHRNDIQPCSKADAVWTALFGACTYARGRGACVLVVGRPQQLTVTTVMPSLSAAMSFATMRVFERWMPTDLSFRERRAQPIRLANSSSRDNRDVECSTGPPATVRCPAVVENCFCCFSLSQQLSARHNVFPVIRATDSALDTSHAFAG